VQAITALPLVLAVAAPAHAQDALKPVRLRAFGHSVNSHSPILATPTETYVPLDVLDALGAKVHTSDNGDSVRVTVPSLSRDGEIAVARPNGEPMVALSDIARLENAVVVRPDTVGGYVHPDPAKLGDQVYLLARVTDARVSNGALHITTSVPVAYRVHMLRDMTPPRGYVDCVGAWVGDEFHPRPVAGDTRATRVRSGQNTEEIARIVVELNRGVRLSGSDSPDNSRTEIVASTEGTPLAGSAPTVVASNNTSRATQPTETVHAGPPPADTAHEVDHEEGDGEHPVAQPATAVQAVARHFGGKQDGSPVEVRSVNVHSDDDGTSHVTIETTGHCISYVRYEQDGQQLVVDLSNATLHLDDPSNQIDVSSGPLLTAVRTAMSQDSPPVARITMDVKRVVGFTVNQTDTELTIDLRRPINATGLLANKLIVVDPGHGGTSTGAVGKGEGTVYEKNVTLAISLKLRDDLEACGARVVMTRDKDVNVALDDRPRMANELHADLFVSVHNDSNGVANSASGTSTYYHMQDPYCRALAACIQHEILKVSDLPSRGVLSDSVMYQHGFAVLRESHMPAILVEVAYINNARDRHRLLDPEFQGKVAKAICDGLKVYVEGSQQTARARTNVEPASAKTTSNVEVDHEDAQ
jgi:N-acetylmuramoyl-L-alanine amidase